MFATTCVFEMLVQGDLAVMYIASVSLCKSQF